MIVNSPPSISRVCPGLMSFVEIICSLSQLDQFVLRRGAQDLTPVLGHRDAVLDADAPNTIEVDPGLDRDYVSWPEGIFRDPPESRLLVDLEPDPMPEAV